MLSFPLMVARPPRNCFFGSFLEIVHSRVFPRRLFGEYSEAGATFAPIASAFLNFEPTMYSFANSPIPPCWSTECTQPTTIRMCSILWSWRCPTSLACSLPTPDTCSTSKHLAGSPRSSSIFALSSATSLAGDRALSFGLGLGFASGGSAFGNIDPGEQRCADDEETDDPQDGGSCVAAHYNEESE